MRRKLTDEERLTLDECESCLNDKFALESSKEKARKWIREILGENQP